MNAINPVSTGPDYATKVARADLRRAVTEASRVVSRCNTIPILGHLLLTREADRMTVKGWDIERMVTAEIHAPSGEPFAMTCDAAALRGFLDAATGEEVAIWRDGDGNAHVQAGTFKAKLMGLQPEDFSGLPAATETVAFEIGADVLRGMFGRVRHCISEEETRYYLNGVSLEVADGRLIAVATDGHRMAVVKAPLPAGANALPSVIVPLSAVDAVLGMVRRGAEAVTVTAGFIERERTITVEGGATKVVNYREWRVSFSVGGATLDAKTIDGTFPGWRSVIPRDPEVRARFKPQALVASIGRVASICTDGWRSRAIIMQTSPDGIALAVKSTNTGDEAADQVRAEMVGAPFETRFQARYLTQMLAQAGGQVTMAAADHTAPTVFTDAADPDAMFVLMPLRA